MKRLYVDIETSPNVVYSWRVGYNINLDAENIIQEREIICISYKWEDSKEIHGLTWDFKKKPGLRDYRMLEKFSAVYKQADEIIAHNGVRFDVKWIRTRILMHDLPPLPKIKIHDTLQKYRQHFNFNSNRLDYVSKVLGMEGKTKMTFSDWKNVMGGDVKALDKMLQYCKKDVKVLADVDKRTRAHFPEKVNGRMLAEHDGSCPECGHKLIKFGLYKTEVSTYQNLRCTNPKHRKVYITTFKVNK
jgi:hypothetical protein